MSDETAELRAASLELVEAVEGWDDQFGLISMVDGGSPAAEKADAAIARLRKEISEGVEA